MRQTERVRILVIGGGQAGLAVGYHLKRRGIPFLILDASQRIGDAWRTRWDSLRLFTPARYCRLPGMRLPARGDAFITKDQMADYLESYAARFALPLRSGVRVDGLTRRGERLVATAGELTFEADEVVVAMGSHQVPKLPAFAKDLSPEIRQLHSFDYRNPSQLVDGDVLIVGVGDSGADIAMDLVRGHRVWLSGKESGAIPVRIESFVGRMVVARMVRFLGHQLLTVRTPMGRSARPQFLRRATPLIRVRPKDLAAAGVGRVPRVVGSRDGLPLLEDGRTLPVANVIWCTGSVPGFDWIRLPAFNADGEPRHEQGIGAEPGLYFVGLEFLYAATSGTIIGVGRDAERVVRAIASRPARDAA